MKEGKMQRQQKVLKYVKNTPQQEKTVQGKNC